MDRAPACGSRPFDRHCRSRIGQWILRPIRAIWRLAVRTANLLWHGLVTALQGIWGWIIRPIQTLWRWIVLAASAIWHGLVAVVLAISHAMASVVEAIGRFTVSVVSTVWGALVAGTRRFWGWIRPPLAAVACGRAGGATRSGEGRWWSSTPFGKQ